MQRLPENQRAALLGYAARASWPAGFQVYACGASADGVFLVTVGRVVLRSRVRAGRGFVPWVATPGETFGAEGLATGGSYVTDARADEETETLFLSSAKLRAFVREQPTSALALIGQIMSERSALLHKLRELTTLSVEQRLVAALQRMTANDSFVQRDGRIELTGAHYRLLCELVGATRESVSLVLGRLTGEGLVERVGGMVYVEPSARLFERLHRGALGEELLVNGLADAQAETALTS
ncbi:MAG: Crp/Fnr family transcriptional regulator [Gemmatimonadaceae bacterium]|nr:Crp/Fnr family transcriptional regulator [Gemmatimonadaceae bacterium]